MKTIKVLRAENNLSQRDLAFKLGVSQTLVSAWERGERELSPMALYAIAYIFDVKEHEIVI